MRINCHRKTCEVTQVKSKILIVLFCFFVTHAMHAAVITFSPGVAYGDNGSTQTLLLQKFPQHLSNRYVANHDAQSTFLAQLFLGKEFYKKDDIKLNLGVTLGFIHDIKLNGVVEQFALPDFDNFNYQYKIQSLSAMGTLNVRYLITEQRQSYLNGSVGFSNNDAFSYQETPRIYGAVPMMPYGDRSTNSFAYSIGVGFMQYFNPLFSVGLGYQFSDFGQAKLGLSTAQQTANTPTINHIFLHQLLLNLNWDL